MAQRILMVDDEPRILDALRRTLYGRYEVTAATSGPEGLEAQRKAMADETPFAVIVSDMMMPGMSGAQFLTRARAVDPDTIRIILSGQADMASTISAVNDADLFRFLTKPCEPAALTKALDDALRQHQLVTAERHLLEQTLRGAVDVLTELLSMAAPEAFSRAGRMKTLVEAGAVAMGMQHDWRLRLAAMLSQIGCIAIPASVLRQVESGTELSGAERAMYLSHPTVAQGLLGRIPRLEEIALWIGRQPVHGSGVPRPDAEPAEMVFDAAAAFLVAHEAEQSVAGAAATLEISGRYPGQLVAALKQAEVGGDGDGPGRKIAALAVRAGMVLLDDVLTSTGMVLVRKGERINETLALRLHNFAGSVGVVEPVLVLEER